MANPSMPASAVRSRDDLGEYLDQSLLTEYHDRVEGRITRQVATSLKSYLVEFHLGDRSPPEAFRSKGFVNVEATDEPSLWRALDSSGAAYFIDLLDDRFPIIHTIAKTNTSDVTVERFVASARGADRCWLPSTFLISQDLGRIIGFRFFHQRVTGGLTDSEEALALARDLGRERAPAFRLAVSEYAHAGDDLQALRTQTLFGARAAIQSMSWRSTFQNARQFIHDEVWSIGKVSAYGTSWEGHLANIRTLRDRYSSILREFESVLAIRWTSEDQPVGILGRALAGSPIEINLSNAPLVDLRAFTSDLLSGKEPFRIWGTETQISETQLAVDAIDLHTGHRFSFDISSELIRVYLKSETCGNVFMRLLCNIEHHLSSEITTSVDEILRGAAR